MSGLFATIASVSSSLDAQTQAINVTSNNIANLNNPNYAREVVNYRTLGMVQTDEGPESMGVAVNVQQASDPLLNQMVMNEAGTTAGYTQEQTIYEQAQAALGESITNSSTSASAASTTSDSGLDSAISAFFNAVQNFASNPSDQGEGAALIQQAGVLTDRFQNIDSNLAQVQDNASSQVTENITQANTLMSGIGTLNTQIASLEAGDPGSAVDLRDQREEDEQQLAALVPIKVTEQDNGEDTITTPGSDGTPVTLVSSGSEQGTLAYANGVVTGGNPAVSLGLGSGSIQGAITASTGAVQTLRDNLNALASQIVTSVNAAYNPSGTAGDNFFSASGTTAGTIALDPNLNESTLVAGTDGAGDNSIALAVAGVANNQFSTAGGDSIDGTISQYYSNTVSGIGQALDTANTNVTDQTAVQNIVTQQQQSVSGVSLNEEMSNLMSYQQAFQASSEVFSIVSSLLSTVVTTLGATSS